MAWIFWWRRPGACSISFKQKQLRLGAVTTLVIDEADRMFDMGFIRDVRKIVAHLPRERHSLLFSATMPDEVAHLVAEILRDPARIDDFAADDRGRQDRAARLSSSMRKTSARCCTIC